jgi:hypothetical protein
MEIIQMENRLVYQGLGMMVVLEDDYEILVEWKFCILIVEVAIKTCAGDDKAQNHTHTLYQCQVPVFDPSTIVT